MSQAENTMLQGRRKQDLIVTGLPEALTAENAVRIFKEAYALTTDLFSHDCLAEKVLCLLN